MMNHNIKETGIEQNMRTQFIAQELVAERMDDNIKEANNTDEDGHLIVEVLNPVEQEEETVEETTEVEE